GKKRKARNKSESPAYDAPCYRGDCPGEHGPNKHEHEVRDPGTNSENPEQGKIYSLRARQRQLEEAAVDPLSPEHSHGFGEENGRAVTLINWCVWQYERVEVENAEGQGEQDERIASHGRVALSLHACLAS